MIKIIKLFRELFVRMSIENPDIFKKVLWTAGMILTLIPIFIGIDTFLELGIGETVVFATLTVSNILISLELFLSGVFMTALTPVKDVEKLVEKLEKKT